MSELTHDGRPIHINSPCPTCGMRGQWLATLCATEGCQFARLIRERDEAVARAEFYSKAWTALRDNLDISDRKADVIVCLVSERNESRALLREVVGLVDEMPPDLVERIDAVLEGQWYRCSECGRHHDAYGNTLEG